METQKPSELLLSHNMGQNPTYVSGKNPTYPHAPGFKVHGPSEQAAINVLGRSCTLRERVYAVLCAAQLTADECATAVGESILSVRPRLSELYKQGKITDTGIRRKNSSGQTASVWRVV